ncbi:spore coat protein YutH [Evansella caseinilytica]|uniref:Spore coat protein YutH n=1 Tax=Evansella caseinilytica TaxID=1503961 RepID=A0A1H3UES4_9BACI|nr:spore coat protein YutH [Evansella caseinilytica]SDZ60355.1 spore coat protein YutH [Evansella caseinilytica]
MLEREMVDHFRIYPDEIVFIGDDQLVYANAETYLLRTIDDRTHQQLSEKISMAQWLTHQGETDIAIYMKPADKRNTLFIDGDDKVVFHIPQQQMHDGSKKMSLGKRLARFHERGYSYSPKDKKVTAFLSSWKERWEKRLDQLEHWYVKISQNPEKTAFDEQFCLTFPYFIGISENAIQMMADLAMNNTANQMTPAKTICHERFQEHSWLTLEEEMESRVKVPTDFTYDHYARDLAEYIRTVWLEHDGNSRGEEMIDTFLNHYESEHPLMLMDQQYLFARLLFPAHYYEKIEQYYQTGHQGKKALLQTDCLRLFHFSADYERLLTFICRRYPLLITGNVIPQWIRKGDFSWQSG